jgi:hypothetical protein
VRRSTKPTQQQATRNGRIAAWREASAGVVRQVHVGLKRRVSKALSKGTMQPEELEAAFFSPTAFRPWNCSPHGDAPDQLPQVLLLESKVGKILGEKKHVTPVMVLSVWSAPAPRLASFGSESKLSRRSVQKHPAAEPVPIAQVGSLRVAVLSSPGSVEMSTGMPARIAMISPFAVLGELQVDAAQSTVRGCTVRLPNAAAQAVADCMKNHAVRDEAAQFHDLLRTAGAKPEPSAGSKDQDRPLTQDMFRKTVPGRRAIGEALVRAAALHEKRGKVVQNKEGVVITSGVQKNLDKAGAGEAQLEYFADRAGAYYEVLHHGESGEKYSHAVFFALEQVCKDFAAFGALLRQLAMFNQPATKAKTLPC